MSRPIRVAVELVFFTGRKGGMETVARELFPTLAAEHDDLRFVGIGNRELAARPPDWFPGEVVPLPVSGESRVGWAAGVGLALGPRARSLGADLLHCPANFAPLVPLLPTVVTVHDLLPLVRPEWVPGGRAGPVGWLLGRSMRAATRVIADSQATAADVRRLAGRPAEEVDVVPLAARLPTPASAGDPTGPAGRPFVLTGGNRMPHKNFELLLRAWQLIPDAERPLLVVTGSHDDDPLEPLVADLGLTGDVDLRSWVPADELAGLYRDAAAYAFPTLFEGFGLPVLEAMVHGCPVIGSDIPVLREVGGDAMVYADPHDPASFAAAVRAVVADPAQRARLARAGTERAAAFTWRRTAELTAASYRRALGRS